ncbi:Oidioi.mRNA.OKI2018_I69.chr1.g3456.t2.cds [Oikopleura dioica]|nr:Oidioi.mRNA.OKI2018_I69.chr1.g3456.t2.cds [Oikopleura dioica]
MADKSPPKMKKRRKKKRDKKARKILESSDEDEEQVPEPFQNNVDSDTTSQMSTSSSCNPYNQMSRLTAKNNYQNATMQQTAAQPLPATPDRLSSISSKSFDTPTPSESLSVPYRYQSPGNFSFDFDFDENTESQMSRGNTQTPDCDNMFKSQPSQSAEDHLLQEFLAQEDANDAHDVQQGVNDLCNGPDSQTQDTQALAALCGSDDEEGDADFAAMMGKNGPKNADSNTNSPTRSIAACVSLGFGSDMNDSRDLMDLDDHEEVETLTEDTNARQKNDSLPLPDIDILNASLQGSTKSNPIDDEPELPPENLDSDEDDNLVIVKKKVKPKAKKPKPGFSMNQFAEADEAELSDDGAKVSDDENEEGLDEYEHEEITEVLPSQRKMEKEIQKVHNKLVRDEDEEIIARIEGKYNDDVAMAQARKSKYKWVINNDGFDNDGNDGSSDEGEVDEEKVKALQNEESDRLKQKLERELLVDQETQESLFTNTQSSLFSSGTAVKLTTKRKKNSFAKGANQKRKDRFGQAFASLSKGDAFSKPMTFQAAEKENRKRQSDGAGSFPKRQKTAPDTPKAQKMKKSLFNQI